MNNIAGVYTIPSDVDPIALRSAFLGSSMDDGAMPTAGETRLLLTVSPGNTRKLELPVLMLDVIRVAEPTLYAVLTEWEVK